jgi:hypothetical protein
VSCLGAKAEVGLGAKAEVGSTAAVGDADTTLAKPLYSCCPVPFKCSFRVLPVQRVADKFFLVGAFVGPDASWCWCTGS